MELSVYYYR